MLVVRSVFRMLDIICSQHAGNVFYKCNSETSAMFCLQITDCDYLTLGVCLSKGYFNMAACAKIIKILNLKI